MSAIKNLMDTAVMLNTAPPQQKAQLLADLITQHSIDIDMLSESLVGRQQRPQQNNELMQLLDQRLQPVTQFMNELQQRRQFGEQQSVQQAQQELNSFMQNPEFEFANDLRQDMADMLEMAANRGQILSLQDAYKRATLLHPQIADIVSQRQSQKVASQQTEAAKRARNAAVSVSSSGAPSQSSESDSGGDDIRSAIEASMRQLAR